MTTRISPNAVAAFKEALTAAFWAKRDLLNWLRSAVPDGGLLDGIDWLGPAYKRDSVSRFVDRLVVHQPESSDLLLRLMSDVAGMDDFPQLEWTDDAATKVETAREAVGRLRRYIEPYEERLQAEAIAQQRIAQRRRDAEARQATTKALENLKQRYLALVDDDDRQAAGRALEPLLRDLFDVFDLDPKAAFRIEGEQIDGGFALDSFHFLLEAKWEKKPTERAQLDAFRAKVQEKAEATLGLFLSISGFEPTAVERHSHRGSPLVLMDGTDLYAVLDDRIDLVDMLRAKRRHASMTGQIYLPVGAIGVG